MGWVIGLLVVIALLLATAIFYLGQILSRLDEMHVAIWRGLHAEFSPYLGEISQEMRRVRDEVQKQGGAVEALRRRLAPAEWERE